MTARGEIGQRIRRARKELGMSQTELGRLLSRQRTHAAISDLERGNVQVRFEELSELARILNKDLAYFTGDKFTLSVTYRRGDSNLSQEQQIETDQAVDAFREFARQRARRSSQS